MKRNILPALGLVIALAAISCSRSQFKWQAVGTEVNGFGCWVNVHGENLPTPSEALGTLKALDGERPETCPKPMPLHVFIRIPNSRSPNLSVQNFPDDDGPKIRFSGVSVPNPSEAEAWEARYCDEKNVTCLTRGMQKDEIYRNGNYRSPDLDPMTPSPTIHGML